MLAMKGPSYSWTTTCQFDYEYDYDSIALQDSFGLESRVLALEYDVWSAVCRFWILGFRKATLNFRVLGRHSLR